MDFLRAALDVFLHIDTHLNTVIQHYGMLTYAVLFAVVFAETGFVVTPFLPGDSLLFAVGSIAALGTLNIFAVYGLFLAAAIGGNSLNFALGRKFGAAVAARTDGGVIRREHLQKTERFFAKYGTKTIILAQFVPIVRTLAPFVAGIGRMPTRTFMIYNVSGALLWVSIFVWSGFWFGRIPWVHDNFELVILVVIVVSFVPPLIEAVRHRLSRQDSGSITP